LKYVSSENKSNKTKKHELCIIVINPSLQHDQNKISNRDYKDGEKKYILRRLTPNKNPNVAQMDIRLNV